MPRRKTEKPAPSKADKDKAADEPVEDEEEAEDEAEIEVEAEAEIVIEDEDDEDLEDEEEDEEEEEEEAAPAAPVVRPPAPRPQPGRPPSAKDEPPPPFAIGERIILIQNTRPRTGTPIGPYPIGATGRVETVLSQTAIIRFDIAPDTKEVVAFTCLKSAEKEEPKKGRPKKEQDGA